MKTANVAEAVKSEHALLIQAEISIWMQQRSV